MGILRWLIAAAVLVAICAASLPAREVVEKYDDGKPHLRYQVDAKDRKNGPYEELFPDGKPKVKGTYLADKKNGTWTLYAASGKPQEVATWRNGMLDGPYQWNFDSGKPQERATYRQNDFVGPILVYDERGHVVRTVSYPRPLDAVLKAWRALSPAKREKPVFVEEPHVGAPYVAGRVAPADLEAALKYTMLYRFCCGLQWQNTTLDPVMCDKDQHAAVLLAKIQHLTHTPEKPDDMDDAFFKLAYAGCHESNLHQGQGSIFDAIDGFMDDSDAGNVEKLGHRQWVMSPSLPRVGFGYCDGWCPMHVLSGGGAPGFNFVAYPGEGYFPRSMVHDGAAWSVHLSRDKVRTGGTSALAVQVTKLDEHFATVDTTAGEIVSVQDNPGAGWTMIVFRHKLKSVEAARYQVQVAGVRTQTGQSVPVSYLVDLREMPPREPQ